MPTSGPSTPAGPWRLEPRTRPGSAPRRHHRLAEPDHLRRTDPAGVLDTLLAEPLDRSPHRLPRHPERPGDRRRGALERFHTIRRHSAARAVSTALGAASAACSVHVFTAQPGSGHAQTRLRHRTSTGRPPAGAARIVTHRRSFARALDPHPEQPTRTAVVCTSATNSTPSTTSSTSHPDAPNQHAPLPSPTTGPPRLGPSNSHETWRGPYLTGGPSPTHPSQLQRAGPPNVGTPGQGGREASRGRQHPGRRPIEPLQFVRLSRAICTNRSLIRATRRWRLINDGPS